MRGRRRMDRRRRRRRRTEAPAPGRRLRARVRRRVRARRTRRDERTRRGGRAAGTRTRPRRRTCARWDGRHARMRSRARENECEVDARRGARAWCARVRARRGTTTLRPRHVIASSVTSTRSHLSKAPSNQSVQNVHPCGVQEQRFRRHASTRLVYRFPLEACSGCPYFSCRACVCILLQRSSSPARSARHALHPPPDVGSPRLRCFRETL